MKLERLGTSQKCEICQQKFADANLNCCIHQFCHKCLTKWLRKHKTCPICRKDSLIMLHSGRTFTIKKSRVTTWRPKPEAPQISLTFKGKHDQLFEGDDDTLLPSLQSFINSVVQISVKNWQGKMKIEMEEESRELNETIKNS